MKDTLSKVSYRLCVTEADGNTSKLSELLGISGDGLSRDGNSWADDFFDENVEVAKAAHCYDNEAEEPTEEWYCMPLQKKEEYLSEKQREKYIAFIIDLIESIMMKLYNSKLCG